MNRIISLLKDISYVLMEILLMSAVYLFAQVLVNDGHAMKLTGILFICLIAVIDYILKIKSANYIFFITGHLILIPFILYLNFSDIEKVAMIVLAVLILIGSISYWQQEVITSRKRTLDMSLISIALFIAIEIACLLMKLQLLLPITAVMGIVFLVLYFIRFYLTNLQLFISTNSESKNTPFQKVFLMNSGYNVMILLLAIFLFLLAYMMNIGRLFHYLGYGIKFIIRKIASLFSREPRPDITIPEDIYNSFPMPEEIEPAYETKPNLLLIFLLKIISYAVFIGFIIFILYMIYRSFKYFMKRYTPKTNVIEFTEPIDIKVKKKKDVKRKSILSLLTGKTNNQKIRKIYYNKVKYFQKCLVDVYAHDTPGEIKSRIKLKTDISVNKLTSLYEQARYGDRELSREDAETAKKAKE